MMDRPKYKLSELLEGHPSPAPAVGETEKIGRKIKIEGPAIDTLDRGGRPPGTDEFFAPAPAVGELAHMKRVCLELGAHKEDIRGQLATAIARISQLEADAKDHGNYILKLEAEAIADEARISQLEAMLEAVPQLVSDTLLTHYSSIFDANDAKEISRSIARALLKGQS